MLSAAVMKALANERRLEILQWLQPATHLPPQRDGDLVKDGVCGRGGGSCGGARRSRAGVARWPVGLNGVDNALRLSQNS